MDIFNNTANVLCILVNCGTGRSLNVLISDLAVLVCQAMNNYREQTYVPFIFATALIKSAYL